MLPRTKMNALLGSQLGKKKSHPDRLLIDHLKNTAELARNLVSNQKCGSYNGLLEIIALTHDIGKVHPKFQKLLEGKGKGVNHAKPSAWFTYSLTEDIWAAEIVSRHHTSLRNIEDMKADWSDEGNYEQIMKNLLPKWPLIISTEQIEQLQDYLFLSINNDVNIEQWQTVRLLYSLLVSADRMDAIGVEKISERDFPSFSYPALPSRSKEIDNWRQTIKINCTKNAKTIKKPGVYTLTLPTGAGKTLTGLEIAYTWAIKFACKSIIYALPFISIVEQTAQVAKEVFGEDYVQEDHSLAYGTDEKNTNGYSRNTNAWKKMSTLFRYWREPIVLTTLVHFWDALFNPKANSTMNFHKLNNAIVILDEPQTISPRYWEGLGQTLSYLSQKWNTTFLLMTATQPQIVSNQEIAPPNILFPYNRHQYEIITESKIKLNELGDLLQNKLPVTSSSGLVVLNRKKAAIEGHRALQNMGLEAPILLLSGWVTPLRRRIILRYLKWLEKKKKKHYLVATQVIEAGVDLDFDWIFRDLGPMDSIVQVAGRCNRHSRENFLGKVLVAEITNEKGNPLWRYVYDDILIEKTKEVLCENPFFSEKDIAGVIDKYYKKIFEGLQSEPVFENLTLGKWGDYSKLIKEENDDLRTVTVFVEENSRLIPMLKKLTETKWELESRDEQKKVVRKIIQYAIEIPVDLIPDCRIFCGNIYTDKDEPIFYPVFEGRAWLLRKEAIKKEGGLYSPLIGFIPPKTEDDSSLQIF